MKNNIPVKDNLVDLISKIGEKLQLEEQNFFDNKNGSNFHYVHNAVEKNRKIIVVVKLSNNTKEMNQEIGIKLAMHIAASNPLSVDKNDLDKQILDKELEIIKAELSNSGKKGD